MSGYSTYPSPCAAHHTCEQTTYAWASPHAPYEFAAICLLLVLMLATWVMYERALRAAREDS